MQYSFIVSRRLKFFSWWDILCLKQNLIKSSSRGKKKKLIAMNSFGVIHLHFATVRSKRGVYLVIPGPGVMKIHHFELDISLVTDMCELVGQ